MKSTRLVHRIAIWLSLIFWLAFALYRLQPPSKDIEGFSTPRAIEHLRFIAAETHPVGSPHHQAVREYLVQQLKLLGFEVELQDGIYRLPLMNILARKPGTAAGNKAVALAAHYDSARGAPGAGDDGAGVVALLETARVLIESPHRNDLMILITDGEEAGLLGARLLAQRQHPWLAQIGVILNFDARGTSGPSIMFETSAGNGWLIDLYARHAPHPVCSSLSYDIYKQMRNGTDFTIFRDESNLQGLNFAFIGSPQNYHRPADDLEHLDQRSLRHHGIQALQLAKPLLEMDLNTPPVTGDAVYFDVASFGVVRYPKSLAPVVAGLAVCLAAIAGVAAVRRGVARMRRVLVGIGILILNLLIVVAATWLMRRFFPGLFFDGNVDWTIAIYMIPAMLISAGCLLAASRSKRRHLHLRSLSRYAGRGVGEGSSMNAHNVPEKEPSPQSSPGVPGEEVNSHAINQARRCNGFELAIAGMAVWVIPTAATAFIFQGGSYLTAWPLVGTAISVLIAAFSTRPIFTALACILCPAPAILLLGPMLYLAFLGLGVSQAPMLIAPIVLGTWLLAMPICYLPQRRTDAAA